MTFSRSFRGQVQLSTLYHDVLYACIKSIRSHFCVNMPILSLMPPVNVGTACFVPEVIFNCSARTAKMSVTTLLEQMY